MKRRYETSDACIPAQTPRHYRMPLRKSVTLEDDEQTHAFADKIGPFGRIYTGFIVLITAFFVKVLLLLWMQKGSVLASTGSVDASQDYVFFWLVMTICVFPILGICVLLYWMATGFNEHQALTKTEHRLLSRGTLAVGKIDAVHGPILHISYTNRDGKRFKTPVELQDLSLRKIWTPGRELTVLVDPKNPRNFLAPELLGVQFRSLTQIVDTRPKTLVGALRAQHADPILQRDCAVRLKEPLPLALDQRSLKERAKELLTLRALRTRTKRSVVLDGNLLMLFENDREDPTTIDLHQPFHIEVSAWLLPRQKAFVRVAVREARESIERVEIDFGVVVDQSQVSASVPLLQSSAPLISTREILPVWEAISFHAAIHGEHVVDLIDFSATHRYDARTQSTQEHAKQLATAQKTT